MYTIHLFFFTDICRSSTGVELYVCVVCREWEIMTGIVMTVIGRALYWSALSAGVFFTQHARTMMLNWRMTTHSSVLSAR